MQFPIFGVDVLHHFRLIVDPAANRLVDTQSSQELSTVSTIAWAIASIKVSPGSLAMDLQAATLFLLH